MFTIAAPAPGKLYAGKDDMIFFCIHFSKHLPLAYGSYHGLFFE